MAENEPDLEYDPEVEELDDEELDLFEGDPEFEDSPATQTSDDRQEDSDA